MKLASVIAAFVGLTFVSSASAHDLWLLEDPNQTGIIQVWYGHPGDIQPVNQEKLYQLKALGGSSSTSLLSDIESKGQMLIAPAKNASLAASSFDNGFWINTTEGYKNANKLLVADSLSSSWALKYAKLLVKGGDADLFSKPVGHRLEIQPLSDPFALKPGEKLKFRVDFEGKPLANAAVTIGDRTKDQSAEVKTDAAGLGEIALLNGNNVLVAEHSVQGSVPKLADVDYLSATLSFTLR